MTADIKDRMIDAHYAALEQMMVGAVMVQPYDLLDDIVIVSHPGSPWCGIATVLALAAGDTP